MPAVFKQSVLFGTLLFSSIDRLSMLRAAHHWVASQLFPTGHLTHPGG